LIKHNNENVIKLNKIFKFSSYEPFDII